MSSTVSTFAGAISSGFLDGQGIQARFNSLCDLIKDSDGNFYAVDTNNHRICKITPSGLVTTFAGSGIAGFANGQGTSAQFNFPRSITLAPNGNFYVTDTMNHKIRQISPSGNVTTLAGSTQGNASGQGSAAKFNEPFGITYFPRDSYLIVSDKNNNRICKITLAGAVSVLTGSSSGASGSSDGYLTTARFNAPTYLYHSPVWETVFVVDSNNFKVRRCDPQGSSSVSTLFGTGVAGYSDGNKATAQVFSPKGLIHTKKGFIYFTDGNRIRKWSFLFDRVDTLFTSTNGLPSSELFGLVVNELTGSLFVNATNQIIEISNVQRPAQIIEPFAGPLSINSRGYVDGEGSSARFSSPSNLVRDFEGNTYVTDVGNFRIRKISPSGTVTTFAGSGIKGHLDGQGTAARFGDSLELAIDSKKNIYVSDRNNHCIRKITPTGYVSTFAGSTQWGYVNGLTTTARFSHPESLAVDKYDNIYVADTGNSVIRKISTDGYVTLYAGTQSGIGYSGLVDGDRLSAKFLSPRSVAIDNTNTMYVGDDTFVRKIDSLGNVTTFAGISNPFSTSQEPDFIGPALQKKFGYIQNIVTSTSKNIFVLDGNSIVKITPNGLVTPVFNESDVLFKDLSINPWNMTFDRITGDAYIVYGAPNSWCAQGVGKITNFNEYPVAFFQDISSYFIKTKSNAKFLGKSKNLIFIDPLSYNS